MAECVFLHFEEDQWSLDHGWIVHRRPWLDISIVLFPQPHLHEYLNDEVKAIDEFYPPEPPINLTWGFRSCLEVGSLDNFKTRISLFCSVVPMLYKLVMLGYSSLIVLSSSFSFVFEWYFCLGTSYLLFLLEWHLFLLYSSNLCLSSEDINLGLMLRSDISVQTSFFFSHSPCIGIWHSSMIVWSSDPHWHISTNFAMLMTLLTTDCVCRITHWEIAGGRQIFT